MQLLEKILDDCLSFEATCCIAGGFCRDKRVGLKPKDCDVLVIDPSIKCDADAFELACKISRYISMFGLGSSAIYQAYGLTSKEDDFSERHYACIKLNLHGVIPIDILIERASTIQEAVNNFDCNLNQYTRNIRSGSSINYYGTLPEDELHFLKPVRQKRIDKMTDFYNKYIKKENN